MSVIGSIATSVGAITSTLFSQGHIRNPYTTFKTVTTYGKDNAIIQCPVAGPAGTPAEIVKVSAPYGYKRVDWVAERQGDFPDLPDLEPDTENQYCKTWFIVASSADLMPDGNTRHFRVEGSYLYLFRVPIELHSGKLFIGKTPFDLSANVSVPPDKFKTELSPGSGGGGGGLNINV